MHHTVFDTVLVCDNRRKLCKMRVFKHAFIFDLKPGTSKTLRTGAPEFTSFFFGARAFTVLVEAIFIGKPERGEVGEFPARICVDLKHTDIMQVPFLPQQTKFSASFPCMHESKYRGLARDRV